jgi:hypothetical protein
MVILMLHINPYPPCFFLIRNVFQKQICEECIGKSLHSNLITHKLESLMMAFLSDMVLTSFLNM